MGRVDYEEIDLSKDDRLLLIVKKEFTYAGHRVDNKHIPLKAVYSRSEDLFHIEIDKGVLLKMTVEQIKNSVFLKFHSEEELRRILNNTRIEFKKKRLSKESMATYFRADSIVLDASYKLTGNDFLNKVKIKKGTDEYIITDKMVDSLTVGLSYEDNIGHVTMTFDSFEDFLLDFSSDVKLRDIYLSIDILLNNNWEGRSNKLSEAVDKYFKAIVSHIYY